jgi:hypothetical protein
MKKSIDKHHDKITKNKETSHKSTGTKSPHKSNQGIKSVKEETKNNISNSNEDSNTSIKNYKIEKSRFKSKADINLYMQVIVYLISCS